MNITHNPIFICNALTQAMHVSISKLVYLPYLNNFFRQYPVFLENFILGKGLASC